VAHPKRSASVIRKIEYREVYQQVIPHVTEERS